VTPLGDEIMHNVTVNVSEAEITASIAVRQFFVIESQQVEDGGMEVVD
jgi:hypothetical protein